MMRVLARLAVLVAALGILMGGTAGALLVKPGTYAVMSDSETVAGAHLRAAVLVDPSAACLFFAQSSSGLFKVSGSAYTFNGCVHSNDDVDVAGNNHVFGGTVYHVGTYSNNANGHTMGDVVKVGQKPAPHTFDLSRYAKSGCKGSAADAKGEWFSHSSNRVTITTSGIHYFERSAEADLTLFSGAVTLVSASPLTVKLGASTITPYVDGLLAHTTHAGSNSGLTLSSADGAEMRGILSSPDSPADLSMQGSLTFRGQVVAHSITVAGGSGSVFHERDVAGPTAC